MSWRIESKSDIEAAPGVVDDFFANPETWGRRAHHTKRASAAVPPCDVMPTGAGCRIHHVMEGGDQVQLLGRPLQSVYGHLLRKKAQRRTDLASNRRPAPAPTAA